MNPVLLLVVVAIVIGLCLTTLLERFADADGAPEDEYE